MGVGADGLVRARGTGPTQVPDVVRPVVDALVDDLVVTVPGLVAAVHLVGSAAQDDVHPGVSDLDAVVVLAAKPDPVAMRLLTDVVGRVTAAHPGWPLDLTWTTTARLRRPPSSGGVVVHHQLVDHALTVHGRPLAPGDVATDDDALRGACLDQIAERWTTWWDGAAVLLTQGGRGSVTGAGPTAAVLGVVRLHHTLVTGRMLTPCAAGEWALEVAEPEWSRLLRESVRARHTPDAPSLYRNPLQRRRDALRFTDLLMTADEESFGAERDEAPAPAPAPARRAQRPGLR